MVTILLWIALAVFVLIFVVIAAPIGFGIKGTLSKSHDANWTFRVSFIHPAVFNFSQTSGEDGGKIALFGFTKKKKISNDDDDDDNVDTINDRDRKISDTGNAIINDTASDNTRADKSADNDITISDDDNVIADDTAQNSADADIAAAIDTGVSINSGFNDSVNNHVHDDGKRSAKTSDPQIQPQPEKRKGDSFIKRKIDKIKNRIDEIKSHKYYKYARDKEFRNKFLRWLRKTPRRLFSAVRIKKLYVNAAVGFKDPARTGTWYGYFTAARGIVRSQSKVARLTMEPVFTERRLSADVEFAGKTSVAMALSAILSIALTFPFLHALKIRRAHRLKNTNKNINKEE